jgi:hypothetical protein
MDALAMVAGAVFSICTQDGCIANPPLRIYPAPINRSGVSFPLPSPYVGPQGSPYVRPWRIPPTAPPVPPSAAYRPSAGDKQLAQQTETEITAFCRDHPQQDFCINLGEWLRRHPQR